MKKIVLFFLFTALAVGAAACAKEKAVEQITATVATSIATNAEIKTEEVTEPHTTEKQTEGNVFTKAFELVTEAVISSVTTELRAKETTKKAATTTEKPDETERVSDSGYDFIYNSNRDFYYTDDKTHWSKNRSYDEFRQDEIGLQGVFLDTVNIRFSYEEKDWLIQLNKGQYGFLLTGGEILVLTAPDGSYTGVTDDTSKYVVADKNDWLKMELDGYVDTHDGKYSGSFHREYGEYWWANGYIKSQLSSYTEPRTEITLKGRITLKSEEMATVFARGLENTGFKKVDSASELAVDTYCQSGSDVYIFWESINGNVFVDK